MRFLIAACVCLCVTSMATAGDLVDFRQDKVKNKAQLMALLDAVNAACGCTVGSIAIGNRIDRGSWRIDFPTGLNQRQIDDANAALKSFSLP